MNVNEVKISIIIPYYNASKYFYKCIETICSQTLKSIEILIIDDGSEENERVRLQNTSKSDSRIRVITIEHSGSGQARNTGIREAKGDYLAFIDADDYLLSDCALEKMYNAAIINNANICGAERHTIVNDSREEWLYKFEKQSEIGGWIEYTEFQECYDYQNYIYRRDFIIENKILFPNLARYQDPPFFVRAMSISEKFWGMHVMYYAYRLGHQDKALIEKRLKCILLGMIDVLEISKVHGYSILQKRIIDNQINDEYLDLICRNISKDNLGLLLRISELIDNPNEIKVYERIKNYSDLEQRVVTVTKSQDLLRRILKLKNDGFSLEDRISNKFGNRILIYGGGYWGNIVYDELKESNLNVLGVIDINNAKIDNIRTYLLNEEIPESDVIVVALLNSEQVVENLKNKFSVPIISIEELIRV